MNQLNQHIEALIFCSDNSITVDEIASALELSFGWELSDDEIKQAVGELKQKYSAEEYSFELCEIAGGYEFLTKKDYHAAITALVQHKSKKKLSVAQMETLAIIAYRQPIAKSEIEQIRGVNCDYAVQKLLEKDLVEISGKSDGPGRSVLYSTSKNFMDYFGINGSQDLPMLKDIRPDQNEIGAPAELTDNVIIEEITKVDTEVTEVVQPDVGNQLTPEDLPDRKSIFLQNSSDQEISGSNITELGRYDSDELPGN